MLETLNNPQPQLGTHLVNTARLPPPADAHKTVCKNKKRLIIFCDGTCEDSLADTVQCPTNITRMSRALSPNAWLQIPRKDGKKMYEEVEQIIHYQPGPGTGENVLLGAAFGTGLSEIVRAAYGFLCFNYNTGDKIYIFGFSRGAYIARSVAHLVADHGLLSKRGMDNFQSVYQSFYNENEQKDTGERLENDSKMPTAAELGLRQLPRGTVEVVGAFDTVGFHNPFVAQFNRVFSQRFRRAGDKNELPNTLLSANVRYAFHALALDENRRPFQTILFFQPKFPWNGAEMSKEDEWRTTLKQMWFSGSHSDIGGGTLDPRLSNLSLMWMISELVYYKLLEFDQNYLLDGSRVRKDHWATAQGRNNPRPKNLLGNVVWMGTPIVVGVKTISAWAIKNVFCNPSLSRKVLGVRTPGLYKPRDLDGYDADPQNFHTHEQFHDSLEDRNLKKWPCQPLSYLGPPQGEYKERAVPPPKSKLGRTVTISKSIMQLPAGAIEKRYRGRLRDIFKAPLKVEEETEIVPIRAEAGSNQEENPFR